MSYATPDDLATALEIRVTPENTQLLQDCLDAAATEIDGFFDAIVGAGVTPAQSPLVKRVNVNRGVEWWKAPAAYNGGVGMNETGTLNVPTSGFERHALALQPLQTGWGVA